MAYLRAGIVAGLIAAVTLTGCGGSAAKPDAKPKISPRTAFLKEVHTHKASFWPADGNPAPTDAQIAVYPPRWCSAASEGHSVDYMFDSNNNSMDYYYPVGDNWGTVIDNARTLVVLGVTAYCPKYRDQIVKDLQSKGEY